MHYFWKWVRTCFGVSQSEIRGNALPEIILIIRVREIMSLLWIQQLFSFKLMSWNPTWESFISFYTRRIFLGNLTWIRAATRALIIVYQLMSDNEGHNSCRLTKACYNSSRESYDHFRKVVLIIRISTFWLQLTRWSQADWCGLRWLQHGVRRSIS